MKCSTKFYHLVPKTYRENLKFRKAVIARCAVDYDYRRTIWSMCARDPLFWINTFCWTYDPRKPDNPRIPFITYEFQDQSIIDIVEAFGNHDVHIDKSRAMGVSWIMIACITWAWIFHPLFSALLVSRKEDLVDKTEDPDSLMWKIDFLLKPKHMPGWMVPRLNRTKLHLANLDNGSVIDGESSNGDVGRGGRRSVIVLDEFAAVPNDVEVEMATQSTTKCRIFNSTPQGDANTFARMRHNPHIKRITLHWSIHPEYSIGLYKDPVNGKLRSPWYDAECRRASHPAVIARELDIDYGGSATQFFEKDLIDRIAADLVHDPIYAGELMFEPTDYVRRRFEESRVGRLKLWFHPIGPEDERVPPSDRLYGIGCDVSLGKGKSESTAAVVDLVTGDKVAEFACDDLSPEKFAVYIAHLARWFRGKDNHGAFVCWETNGAGELFINGLNEASYTHIYYRRNEKDVVKKDTTMPGWYSTPESKFKLLCEYRTALLKGEYTNRSYRAVEQCREYVFVDSKRVEHARARELVDLDPSASCELHGDLVIADALAFRTMAHVKSAKPTVNSETAAPRGSFAERRERHRRKQRGRDLAASEY